MISAGNLAGYSAVSFVLIAIPGPSVLFVIGRALSLGRGPAIASVVGNAVGVYVVAVLVAFGLGALVQRSDAAFLAVKLAGGLYLLWLGIQAIRHRHDLAAALDVQVPQVSRWRAVGRGPPPPGPPATAWVLLVVATPHLRGVAVVESEIRPDRRHDRRKLPRLWGRLDHEPAAPRAHRAGRPRRP